VAIGRFVARVILACHTRRIPWVVENPPRRDLPGILGYWREYADYGTLWHALNADSRLASVDFQDVTFPYCALGAAYQKVTTLRSNSGPLILASEAWCAPTAGTRRGCTGKRQMVTPGRGSPRRTRRP